jgi:hypothetical protein
MRVKDEGSFEDAVHRAGRGLSARPVSEEGRSVAKKLLPLKTYTDTIKRWTFVWLVFDALIHL